MASPIIGPPARGDDFFDREQEQTKLWRSLEHNSVLLLSARRVGKTSLLFRLAATASEHNVRAVEESAASSQTEFELVKRLYDAVARVDRSALENLLRSPLLQRVVPKKVEALGLGVEFAEGAETAWPELGRALWQMLADSGQRWLILLDELPIFVLKLLRAPEGRDRAVAFLDWFRDLRQHTPEVRWVIAGSVGLDTLAERHRFTASINDLQIVHLGAFSAASARRYLELLSASAPRRLDDATLDHLLARVGWPLPYFLNLMVHELTDLMDEGVPPTPAAVDEAFARLTATEKRSYFDHWRQRLPDQFDLPHARLAHRLLDAISHSPDGASEDTLRQLDADDTALRDLLNGLAVDGYLLRAGDRWAFRSPLLRHWWSQHALGRLP